MKTLNDFNFENKKALIRVDFNVPLDGDFNVADSKQNRSGETNYYQGARRRWICNFDEPLRKTKGRKKPRHVFKTYM